MRKVIGLFILGCAMYGNAQSNDALIKHFEAYYQQMKTQGDEQGVFNALTHLNVLSPNQARKDTLAAFYMNAGRHLQALNTIGVDTNTGDSDLAVEVKAVSLKALNQQQRAIPHFEELFKRKPNTLIAYELADLKIQTQDFAGATRHIDYGLANAKDDVKRAYYENRQQPYQVSIKSAFTYLKGLLKYSQDQKANIDEAIGLFNEALTLDANFNLAKLSKDALEAQKNQTTENGN